VRIELHPEADVEFAGQVEYFDEREPGLGERFYREVNDCLKLIADPPRFWPGDIRGRAPQLR